MRAIRSDAYSAPTRRDGHISPAGRAAPRSQTPALLVDQLTHIVVFIRIGMRIHSPFQWYTSLFRHQKKSSPKIVFKCKSSFFMEFK